MNAQLPLVERLVREEIAQHLGPGSCARLHIHVEAYTPEGTTEPLVSITLSPVCRSGSDGSLPAGARGGAFLLRTVTTPERLAWAVRETTRGVLQQLGLL
jgi:hypothetical protein